MKVLMASDPARLSHDMQPADSLNLVLRILRQFSDACSPSGIRTMKSRLVIAPFILMIASRSQPSIWEEHVSGISAYTSIGF